MKSYQTYGFSYSILNSIYPYLGSNQLVYDENMDEIMNAMSLPVAAQMRSTIDSESPYNLIVVQLESFMDPLLIQGAEYSEDPIATFRALTEYSGCQRLFLHADTLIFEHPIHSIKIEIKANLDEQWMKVMELFNWSI